MRLKIACIAYTDYLPLVISPLVIWSVVIQLGKQSSSKWTEHTCVGNENGFRGLSRLEWPTGIGCVSLQAADGNVLFNDALNTFYLRLYGVRHKVKDHSDNERGNKLPPIGLLFPISSKGSQRQDCTYHGLCCTSRGALAGTRNSSMGPLDEGSHHEWMLLPQSYNIMLF